MTTHHLAHLVHGLPVGGTERLVEQMLRQPPEGFTVSGICLDELGTLGEALEKDGVPMACLGRKPGVDLALAYRLARVARKQRVEILHCHQYTPWFYASLARVFHPGLKVIFTEHGRFHPDIPSPRRRIFNRFFGPLTQVITAVSPPTKQALVDVEAFRPGQIRVLFNGVRPPPALPTREECRQSLDLPPDGVFFILCARFDTIKWIPGLVRAFAKVAEADPKAFLLLLGDGPEMGVVTSLIAELGIEGRVRLPGFRDDIPKWLKAADIFVLSSLSEGTSVSLIESMAMGLPCVATRVGGNEFVMEDGRTGLLVPPRDVEALGAAMLRLLRDADLRKEFGAGARRRFEERFRIESMFTAYAGIYRDLLGEKERKP